jgi:AbrB family looped-hinge helix DNA binding protein
MSEILVTIDETGRILIPAAYRRAMAISAGEKLILRLDNGTLRLLTRCQAVELAQLLVRPHVAEGRSLAQELLAERRREVAGE